MAIQTRGRFLRFDRKAPTIILTVVAALTAIATAAPPKATSSPAPSEPILDRKGCLSCHRFAGRGNKGSDLAFASGGEWTESGFASSLWNHGPRMWERAQKEKRELPTLSRTDAEELFATLAAKRPFAKDPAGRPFEGKRAFLSHHCTDCHGEVDSTSGGGFAAVGRVGSVPALTSALWQSLPKMMGDSKTAERWPHLSAADMRDLLAYLEAPKKAK